MNTFTCTRRIQFCAGHRVNGHENKCRNLHGHNYVAFITAEAHELDNIGRVIDFGVLKEIVGRWIEESWDHGFILHTNDYEAQRAMGTMNNQKLYLMEENPTAENMALELKREADHLLPDHIHVVKVVLWETENCYAEA